MPEYREKSRVCSMITENIDPLFIDEFRVIDRLTDLYSPLIKLNGHNSDCYARWSQVNKVWNSRTIAIRRHYKDHAGPKCEFLIMFIITQIYYNFQRARWKTTEGDSYSENKYFFRKWFWYKIIFLKKYFKWS